MFNIGFNLKLFINSPLTYCFHGTFQKVVGSRTISYYYTSTILGAGKKLILPLNIP